jgi:hypothetical protein
LVIGEHHSEKRGAIKNIALDDSDEGGIFSDSGNSELARYDEEMDINEVST